MRYKYILLINFLISLHQELCGMEGLGEENTSLLAILASAAATVNDVGVAGAGGGGSGGGGSGAASQPESGISIFDGEDITELCKTISTPKMTYRALSEKNKERVKQMFALALGEIPMTIESALEDPEEAIKIFKSKYGFPLENKFALRERDVEKIFSKKAFQSWEDFKRKRRKDHQALLAEIPVLAITMKSGAKVPCQEITEYLENKYSVLIGRQTLFRHKSGKPTLSSVKEEAESFSPSDAGGGSAGAGGGGSGGASTSEATEAPLPALEDLLVFLSDPSHQDQQKVLGALSQLDACLSSNKAVASISAGGGGGASAPAASASASFEYTGLEAHQAFLSSLSPDLQTVVYGFLTNPRLNKGIAAHLKIIGRNRIEALKPLLTLDMVKHHYSIISAFSGVSEELMNDAVSHVQKQLKSKRSYATIQDALAQFLEENASAGSNKRARGGE